jgi:hypothetical protein
MWTAKQHIHWFLHVLADHAIRRKLSCTEASSVPSEIQGINMLHV